MPAAVLPIPAIIVLFWKPWNRAPAMKKAKKVADGTLIFIPPAVLSPRFITTPFTGALS
ncbi:hypothetical protein M8494_29785 [Serratia ureilytica]